MLTCLDHSDLSQKRKVPLDNFLLSLDNPDLLDFWQTNGVNLEALTRQVQELNN